MGTGPGGVLVLVPSDLAVVAAMVVEEDMGVGGVEAAVVDVDGVEVGWGIEAADPQRAWVYRLPIADRTLQAVSAVVELAVLPLEGAAIEGVVAVVAASGRDEAESEVGGTPGPTAVQGEVVGGGKPDRVE